jgi:hypothetical protein
VSTLHIITSVSFTGEISSNGEFFFSKMLILAKKFQKLIFLSPKFSSNMTISHPIWPFFIHSNNFSSNYDDSIQNLDESAALFFIIGATRSINENLQNKHWLSPSPFSSSLLGWLSKTDIVPSTMVITLAIVTSSMKQHHHETIIF